MRKLAIVLLLFAAAANAATFTTGNPSTTNNDDSCDISVLPAATLLLPYFEVDYKAPQTTARTTLFTITNTVQIPQIAHVTLWTDWGFPVVDFNIFLTGYDVQAINLYDILGSRGIIAPPRGTSNQEDAGARSLENDANILFSPGSTVNCSVLPGVIPQVLLKDIQSGLSAGTYGACGTTRIGGTHTNAVGYATIDVISNCTTTLPTDPAYANELLYDNVLTGDYEWIDPNPTTGNFAGGNPLVHIRAIPEGGPSGTPTQSNLPYTFYSRYAQGDNTRDRRQPLPPAFAARFVQGGTGAFNTDLRIWRSGVTGTNPTCASIAQNGAMPIREVVRFDEHENPSINVPCPLPILCNLPASTLPETSSTPTTAALFPPLVSPSNDVGGWIYLNLARGDAPGGNQNWVVTSMSAEGRYQVVFDALMLANGCTAAPAMSNTSTNPIGPGPNVNP